ncbi:MAG: hypothetical protein ACKPE6_03705 [Gammaproteobacteria bacterium]
MSDAGAATGTLENALKQATALAVEQALAILEAVPAHPPAILLLARARRALGDLDVERHPRGPRRGETALGTGAGRARDRARIARPG